MDGALQAPRGLIFRRLEWTIFSENDYKPRKSRGTGVSPLDGRRRRHWLAPMQMSEPIKPKPDLEAEAALAAGELPENYFELYKLAVEMADRISARRGVANSFFLTVNTGVVAVLSARNVRWYLAVAGIVFSVTWWALLRSYRELNRAKFDVILAMEERLPVRPFGDEWDQLRRQPARFGVRHGALQLWLGQYRELGRVERIVPWVFVLIYLAEILRQLVR